MGSRKGFPCPACGATLDGEEPIEDSYWCADCGRFVRPGITVTLLRPRWCPRWLWWLSSSNPTYRVVPYDQHAASAPQVVGSWGKTVSLEVPREGAMVLIDHTLSSWATSALQEVEMHAMPGDDFVYRASWLPRGPRTVYPRKRRSDVPSPRPYERDHGLNSGPSQDWERRLAHNLGVDEPLENEPATDALTSERSPQGRTDDEGTE